MIRSIHLVRHGVTPDNLECVFSGNRNPELEPAGVEQAKVAGNSLGFVPDAIICSPLKRTVMTARILAETTGFNVGDIEINRLLRERSYGDLEGRPHLVMDETTAEAQNILAQAGAEPLDELYKRQKAFYNQILSKEKYHDARLLVVGHNTAGRALLRVVRGLPFDGMTESIPNATPMQIWPIAEH